MTNDATGPNRTGDDEIERRLEAYARARLSPDPAATSRIRAAIMAEARERTRPRFRLLPGFRRPAIALVAASLAVLLAVGGAFAASRPGGPLYDTRVWLETLTLPSDPAARAQAELVRLQERLDEAEAAARDGNGPAVTAALDEYSKIVGETLAATGGQAGNVAGLEDALQRHLAVLQALSGRLPDQASNAVEQALQRQEQKISQILAEHPVNPNAGGTNPGGQTPGGPKPSTPAGSPPASTGPGTGQGSGQGQGGGQGHGAEPSPSPGRPDQPGSQASPHPSKSPKP